MCEVAGVYDAVPAPRTPEEIIATPAQKRKEKKAQAKKGKRKKKQRKPREPQARNKWLTASVTDDIPAVIAAAFDEAERRSSSDMLAATITPSTDNGINADAQAPHRAAEWRT